MALDNELSANQLSSSTSVPSVVFSMDTSAAETSESYLTSVAFQIINQICSW